MIRLPRHKWTRNPKTKIKESKKIYSRRKKEKERQEEILRGGISGLLQADQLIM